MKAVIDLQTKPSCLWGSTMCRGTLSFWDHFSSLGFCCALVGFYLSVSVLVVWVLVGSRVLGAPPAQGSGLGSGAGLMSLQPTAVTFGQWPGISVPGYSALLAGEPWAQRALLVGCWVPRAGRAVCRAPSAAAAAGAAGEATQEGLCRNQARLSHGHAVRKPSPSSVCRRLGYPEALRDRTFCACRAALPVRGPVCSWGSHLVWRQEPAAEAIPWLPCTGDSAEQSDAALQCQWRPSRPGGRAESARGSRGARCVPPLQNIQK